MDPVAILQEVVEQDGDCDDWAGPAICKRCPLGAKRIDGRRFNCWDYINQRYGLESKTEEEVRETYKLAAEDELFTIQLEELLE